MNKMKLKLMAAGVLVSCAFGLIALNVRATPGSGLALAAVLASDDDGRERGNTQVARLHELQAAFHGAISYNGDPVDRAENLEFLETLWAPDATLTVGGTTLDGRDAVMAWFANSAPPFIQNRNWVSLTPSFRTEFEARGRKADISFICVLVDPATDMVVGKTSFSGTAKKVRGEWVFWDMNIAPTTL